MSKKSNKVFALGLQPADYQISVHLNNLVACYGKEMINAVLRNEAVADYILVANVCNLRSHFGIAKVRQMWELICPVRGQRAG